MELQHSKPRSCFDAKPSKGASFIGVKKVTVPSQAMSLREILTRFVRNEKLSVGHDVNYGDVGVDLEKMKYSDLVDRAEFSEKLKRVARYHESKARRAREDAEKRANPQTANSSEKREEQKPEGRAGDGAAASGTDKKPE